MDEKSMEELKTKVASLKGDASILKVSNLAGKAFSLNVTATSIVTGTYGEQLLLAGTIDYKGDLDMDEGLEVRLYLNNRRRDTFEAVFDGERVYSFVFGESVTLKNGYDYIPLDAVVLQEL
jgi:hypothetical protein